MHLGFLHLVTPHKQQAKRQSQAESRETLTCKMKFSASILLVALCTLHSASAERGRTSAQEENRALNSRWPPKNLDIPGNRRWHAWAWSGGATQNQLTRAGHRHPKSGASEEYYDDDEYYYGPSESKNNKRPSETNFHHMVKMPKHGKVSLTEQEMCRRYVMKYNNILIQKFVRPF